jgi:outer membrane protein assembly factor BamB
LPSSASFLWTTRLSSDGLGGLAVAGGVVVAGCRDITDTRDIFYCLDAGTGAIRWQFQYPAPCSFDYGNSPRATPVIAGDRVWTMGAAGHVHCLELETGNIVWQKNVALEFQTPHLEWGLAGSPLLVDGKLIVQAGGRGACLVALDAMTGDAVWTSDPGLPGHSSFITAAIGGRTQLIGYDEASLGGWDLDTGKRLWGVIPKVKGDFNVPTPVLVGNRLVASTENNATRLYEFTASGELNPAPVAQNKKLTPDSSSLVAMGSRVYGLTDGLFCLDTESGLAEKWVVDHAHLIGYGSVIACPPLKRLLVLTLDCHLLLVEDLDSTGRVLSDLALTQGDAETHSHPAIVGDLIYVRLGRSLSALRLTDDRPER